MGPVKVKIISEDNEASNGARINSDVNIDNGEVKRQEKGNTFEDATLSAKTFIKDGDVEINVKKEKLKNAETSREVTEKTEIQEEAEVGAKIENEPDFR